MNWPSKSPDALLKRSISTIDLTAVRTDLCLREARSFSGALDECRYNDSCTETDSNQLESTDNCQKICGKEQAGFITREVSSNQIFVVNDDMLMYRGKRYSFSDIAIRWKKDCRMWLWKSKNRKPNKNRSLSELIEKVDGVKIG